MTGWGHWEFLLLTPQVAKTSVLQAQYGGLLSLLHEYIQRIPVEGSRAPRLLEWRTRPELLGITVRGGASTYKDLYIHGTPDEILGSEWFPFSLQGNPWVLHGRKYSGQSRLEFIDFREVVHAGETEFQIELTLDLLQLQGLNGITWWNSGGGPTDPK